MPRELMLPPSDQYTEAKFMSYGPKTWRLEVSMYDTEAYEYAVLNVTPENVDAWIAHLQTIKAELEADE